MPPVPVLAGFEALQLRPRLGERRIVVPGFPRRAVLPDADDDALVHGIERHEELSGNPPGLMPGGGKPLAHGGVPLGLGALPEDDMRDDGHHERTPPRQAVAATVPPPTRA